MMVVDPQRALVWFRRILTTVTLGIEARTDVWRSRRLSCWPFAICQPRAAELAENG